MKIFFIIFFCSSIPSYSFGFTDTTTKSNTVFIENQTDSANFGNPDIIQSGIPKGATIIIPDTNSPAGTGYIQIPMGNSTNSIFLEFSLAKGAPNNYALAYNLANSITESTQHIERILTDNSRRKDRAMKYPSQKNIIVKLHETTIPGSTPNTSGNFVMQSGPSDFINIAIREPLLMKRTFVHEFIHFFNRDVIDGNISVTLSETLTVLFEGTCVPNTTDRTYRFCGSSDLYDAITSKGVLDPAKLVDVVSGALLANNHYLGHEYQVAELLGQVMMEKLAVEMPRASMNARIIEATKRIISIQKDFSRILPTNVDGDSIWSEKPKALNTIATKLGFTEGFSDMASSIGTYYEKNVYAGAKQVAGLKIFLQELRAMNAEETQLEIPPPPKAAKKLTVAPQSQNPSPLGAIPKRDVIKIFPERPYGGPAPPS